jgi:hypothetical protein
VLITNHVAQGAVIGALAPGPGSAFLAGVASHFAVDSMPHWGVPDHEVFLKVAVRDGLAGLTAMAWLTRSASPARRNSVLAGMLGACFPDADKPSNLFFGGSPFPETWDRWHADIQREEPQRMPQEIVLAATGLLLATLLVRRSGRLRGGLPAR